jgi:hypothetical protein
MEDSNLAINIFWATGQCSESRILAAGRWLEMLAEEEDVCFVARERHPGKARQGK